MSSIAAGSTARPTLATLVYCVRDGEVLLLERRNDPFAGSWVGPGGPHCHLTRTHSEREGDMIGVTFRR